MTDQIYSSAVENHAQRSYTPNFVRTIHKRPYDAINPSRPALSAKGKVVLITGGATGIGFAITQNFAAAGASTIVILGRRASALQTAAAAINKAYPATQVLTYPVDVRDAAAITQTLASAVADASTHAIDILVTNAAYQGPPALAHEFLASDIRTAYELNVIGNLHLIQQFLSTPSSQKKIVLDVSSTAILQAFPTLGVYGATKFGLTFLLKHIRDDNPGKVRVHSFNPGAIWTEGMEKFGIEKEKMEAILDDEQLPGAFAVWLASPEAEFLDGRFAMAKWDVEDLAKNREAFERDPSFATVTLHI